MLYVLCHGVRICCKYANSFLMLCQCTRFVYRCVILCNFNCSTLSRNNCKVVTNLIAGGGGRNSFGGYQDQGPPEEVSHVYVNTVTLRHRGYKLLIWYTVHLFRVCNLSLSHYFIVYMVT
jgi:hypothetical protein